MIMEDSTERLKKGWNAGTDIKYGMVKYEMHLINSYAFNYQSKQSDKKIYSTY